MSPEFSVHVERYEAFTPEELQDSIDRMDKTLKHYQSMLAAARKAQKNQKRAAKKHSDAKAS